MHVAVSFSYLLPLILHKHGQLTVCPDITLVNTTCNVNITISDAINTARKTVNALKDLLSSFPKHLSSSAAAAEASSSLQKRHRYVLNWFKSYLLSSRTIRDDG